MPVGTGGQVPGEVQARWQRVAARELIVRAHPAAWQPDLVVDDGESALLRVPSPGVDPMLVGVGDVGRVAAMVRARAAALGPIRFAILPYGTLEAHPRLMADSLDMEPVGPWAWLYCRTAPPVQRGEEHVRPLDAADLPEVEALLELANPDTHARGRGDVQWWGYVREGRLLGVCGVTLPDAPPGSALARAEGARLAGLGTHPQARRQGVGAAMMAAITRWGVERYGLVHYGVWLDNEAAFRIYRRLGYTTGALVQSYGGRR